MYCLLLHFLLCTVLIGTTVVSIKRIWDRYIPLPGTELCNKRVQSITLKIRKTERRLKGIGLSEILKVKIMGSLKMQHFPYGRGR